MATIQLIKLFLPNNLIIILIKSLHFHRFRLLKLTNLFVSLTIAQ